VVNSLTSSIASSTAHDATLIRDALTQHYVAHGLPLDGGASNPWFNVRIGPMTIPLPNPPARRRAVVMHDINHIVTGYNTTFSEGEMSIAAFEVGAGCGRLAIVWFINLSLLALALVVHPRIAFAGFVRGRRSASIYANIEDATTLNEMSVERVRSILRIASADTPPRFSDRVLFAVWGAIAVVVFLAPLLVVLLPLWALIR
jgi:hypothetical protein